jgi:hypothetical protein
MVMNSRKMKRRRWAAPCGSVSDSRLRALDCACTLGSDQATHRAAAEIASDWTHRNRRRRRSAPEGRCCLVSREERKESDRRVAWRADRSNTALQAPREWSEFVVRAHRGIEDIFVQEIGDLLRGPGVGGGKARRRYFRFPWSGNEMFVGDAGVDGCRRKDCRSYVRSRPISEGVLGGHSLSKEDRMRSTPAHTWPSCHR